MNDLEQEFLKLVDEYRSLLYKVCLMYESEWQTHEDLMQDVIVNLWRAYPTFRKEGKVSTWIYRIALNTCISQFRKRQSRLDTMPLKYNFDILADDDEDAPDDIRGISVDFIFLANFGQADLDKENYSLSNGKKTYKLGDRVKIKVVGINYGDKRAEFLFV